MAREAGLLDRCRLHGLKKAGMTRRANAGNTAHELMAASGHKTLAMVQLYTKAFHDRKLAASGTAKLPGSYKPTKPNFTNHSLTR